MDKIIDLLISAELITKDKINEFLKDKKEKKVTLKTLITNRVIDPQKAYTIIADEIRNGNLTISMIEQNISPEHADKILEHLAKLMHMEYVDLDEVDFDLHLLSKLPLSKLEKIGALPIKECDLNILVAFKDPFDINAQESIQRMLPKKPITAGIARPSQIEYHLNRLEMSESIKGLINEIREEISKNVSTSEASESSAILKLIEVILKSAILSRGSDIHIEPTENSCIIRTRIDGMLTESFRFNKDIYPPLSSRIKLLSNLDIAERRKPQDGRFSATVLQKTYDFRVSTLPIINGESIVLRILDKSKAMIKLEDAGMSQKNFNIFSEALKVPYGIVLVTGPTGSGKTTTLYGALNNLKSIDRKVITVEDPVEYQMNLIQQVQVNQKVGLTFANTLRSILRQDPDIIMIGEIRDHETLRIAIQAALTGHLVLSTLHTNDAISAITRMADMGIEPYLISGSLIAIEAQRLVRKICPHCKQPVEIPEHAIEELHQYLPEKYQFYKGKGCKECHSTGYIGREMISEVLRVDDTLSSLIAKEASKAEILEVASKNGYVSMIQDGINKVLNGTTTIDEVLRVARLT
ncbi:GspE/PulE family protein [Hydrogenimonas thermophila]|uniref:GspE/PulE family protein n=1 Tax=Hydrogenimonas thermophila TaxID=223786 RepID=UPI002936E47A|nr:GspE/PulE family protein [Hydrogenimonas thermophila]WOE68939.1 GspE/PulE family protein [Hydrogenimonas thermophila]WOE71446.1 GspE/PulE family protein [Hydrogenimonas thermophila]